MTAEQGALLLVLRHFWCLNSILSLVDSNAWSCQLLKLFANWYFIWTICLLWFLAVLGDQMLVRKVSSKLSVAVLCCAVAVFLRFSANAERALADYKLKWLNARITETLLLFLLWFLVIINWQFVFKHVAYTLCLRF